MVHILQFNLPLTTLEIPFIASSMTTSTDTAIGIGMKKQHGFTLLELIWTMAIAGIVASFAAPMFGDLVKNNRMATQANTVIGSLRYARSEAITRGVMTQLEPVVAGNNWSEGWVVRIDGDNDGVIDSDDDDDVVIRSFVRVDDSSLMLSNAGTIVFNPEGDVPTASVADLTLRAISCTDEHQRVISVSLSGLITLSDDKSC